MKSEEYIVDVNPTIYNVVAINPNNSSDAEPTGERPQEKDEVKPDLKVLPVVIPDDQKDTPKSPDSSKGSNETL